MIHTYLGESIRFEINYKNRTSMGISIDLYGNVKVQVPKGTSDEYVLQVLEGKWDWIQQKLKEMKGRTLGPTEKVYDNGESFLYLGNSYPIQISQATDIKQD